MFSPLFAVSIADTDFPLGTVTLPGVDSEAAVLFVTSQGVDLFFFFSSQKKLHFVISNFS